MKEAQHRGYTICWFVEKRGGKEFWNARGRIEFYQGQSFCCLNLTGSENKFTSEDEAEKDFLTKAKNWIDRRSHSRHHEQAL